MSLTGLNSVFGELTRLRSHGLKEHSGDTIINSLDKGSPQGVRRKRSLEKHCQSQDLTFNGPQGQGLVQT